MSEERVIPRSSLEIARDILAAEGFQDRGATMLAIAFSADIRRSTVKAFIQGRDPDTAFNRRLVEERLHEAVLDTDDPLWANAELWEAGKKHLRFAYLDHTITSKTNELVEDAQVVYLLAALTLGSWGKTRPFAYSETINSDMEEQLREFARRTASAKDWEEMAAVAAEFNASPLAEEMLDAAEVLNRKYFKPGGTYGTAADDLLVAGAVLKNHEGVMRAARQIYKEAFGLDIDAVESAETSS